MQGRRQSIAPRVQARPGRAGRRRVRGLVPGRVDTRAPAALSWSADGRSGKRRPAQPGGHGPASGTSSGLPRHNGGRPGNHAVSLVTFETIPPHAQTGPQRPRDHPGCLPGPARSGHALPGAARLSRERKKRQINIAVLKTAWPSGTRTDIASLPPCDQIYPAQAPGLTYQGQPIAPSGAVLSEIRHNIGGLPFGPIRPAAGGTVGSCRSGSWAAPR